MTMPADDAHAYPRWMHRLGMVRCGRVQPTNQLVCKLRKPAVSLYGAGVLVVVAVLLLTFVAPVHHWFRCLLSAGDCEVQAVEINGRTEYVGVSDTQVFRPDYAHLMKVLEKENAYATGGGPGTYVTVAVAGPLSMTEPRTLHRLEGAVAGQYDANHSALVGDRPRIRLVLANMGSTEAYWKPVADRLAGMIGGPDHLEAVAGMGLSQAETVDAMNVLRARHVPTIGDMITASTIDQHSYPPFARVGPDTAQQLDVLGRYLGPKLAHHKAMLVAYSKRTDMYTSALTSDFQRYLGGPWRAGGRQVTPFGDRPGSEFPVIVRILCGVRGLDTVFYAGRAADLPLFLKYLGNRPGCGPGKVTVVSTSDTSRLLAPTRENRQAWQALRRADRPIRLIYTPLADPEVLAGRKETARSIGDLRRLFPRLGFPARDLDTGWAVMEHDAVLTAAQAIHVAAGDTGRPPPPQTVAEQLRLMSTPSTAVPGASGPIRLDPRTGDRYDLRIPVLEFVPGAPSKVLGVLPPSHP